ncbi:MAG: hypothetical protein AAF471_03540, partial [Myxococcota bacterium]
RHKQQENKKMKQTKTNTVARLALGIALFTQFGLVQSAQATKGQIGYFKQSCPSGWEYYDRLAGRVIVGAGRHDGQKYDSGNAGGERRHKLTEREMPSHYHSNGTMGIHRNYGGGAEGNKASWPLGPYKTYRNADTSPVGGNQPHNNMQPYLVLTPCIKMVDDDEKVSLLQAQVASLLENNNSNDQEKKENANNNGIDPKELEKINKRIKALRTFVFNLASDSKPKPRKVYDSDYDE